MYYNRVMLYNKPGMEFVTLLRAGPLANIVIPACASVCEQGMGSGQHGVHSKLRALVDSLPNSPVDSSGTGSVPLNNPAADRQRSVKATQLQANTINNSTSLHRMVASKVCAYFCMLNHFG